MTGLMAVPDSRSFSRLVELYEQNYKELDQIYLSALQHFKGIKLSRFGDNEVTLILYPYLLKWGKMRRVLGYRGCKRIGEKLKEIAHQLGEFQHLALSTTDTNRMFKKIEGVYNEILNTEWKSEKGRIKRVGPTATSKALHIIAPSLFIIWDRAIRKHYGFKENGAEYVRFLLNMRNWMEKLGKSIANLQKQYEKSSTKIIDEYNWMKSNWKPDSGKKVVNEQPATTGMVRELKRQVECVLVRNHLLCPYADCVCHERSQDLRIQVIVNQANSKRQVFLKKTVEGERGRTSLPYNYTKEVYSGHCPYCLRPVEVVIEETHVTRYVHLRLS